MDSIVHGVTNGRTRLSNFHFTSLHLVVYNFTTCVGSYVDYCSQDKEQFHCHEELFIALLLTNLPSSAPPPSLSCSSSSSSVNS